MYVLLIVGSINVDNYMVNMIAVKVIKNNFV